MSHHVYTTRGVVLSLKPTKEADKLATILTRDLGLIHGSARGIRKLDSKLSSPLSELALVRVSLVKGKRSWRVTTTGLIRNSYVELRQNRKALEALSRIFGLLRTMVRGEDKNIELYDELEENLLNMLDDQKKDPEIWELYTVSRLLSHLGYLSKDKIPKSFEDVEERKKEFVSLVNFGIHESGLS